MCCNSKCVNGSSCLGHYCKSFYDCLYTSSESFCNSTCVNGLLGCSCASDFDCSRNESCRENKCVNGRGIGSSCEGDSDCASGKKCCTSKCVKGSDCLGQSCQSDSDCSPGEGFRNSNCKQGTDGCIGFPRTTGSDCGISGDESCCDGKCSSGSYCTISALPLVAIFGSLFLIFVMGLTALLICRRDKRRQRRTQTQGNQHYPDQAPPSYQHDSPDYPPPEYEEHPTVITSPYNPETRRVIKPPPPYNSVSQVESGGVYSPQTSYGAI